MENLDEALGKLLSDPNAMAQVMSLAQSLGAMMPQETPSQTQETAFPIQGLEKLMQSAGGNGRHTALFQALGPFLSPKRRKKLERALQIGRLSGLASLALQQTDREE
ncbi:MAG: hypothetical protein E7464_00980 [Ruminococcaceae bacterium]|nr:hypothetical protein [Oscillospiraceae bacterium]